MSQENVEIVRAWFEAWGRVGLDALALDAVAEFWDTGIDWRAAEGAPDDVGPIRGVDAMRAYAQQWLDDFDDLRLEAEELIDAGGEQVVAVQRMSGRGKASGIETELRFAVVYTIRNGKIVRGREYWERAQALAAVGLSE